MRPYTDSDGRTWHLRVNPRTLGLLKERLGFDVRSMLMGDAFTWLGETVADRERLADVLWTLLEEQAAREDVSEYVFRESLQDEILLRAIPALVRAFADATDIKIAKREMMRLITQFEMEN